MEPAVSQTQVNRVLDDMREAFTQKQMQNGWSLMEQALELNVSWEALTLAVGEGISGLTPAP